MSEHFKPLISFYSVFWTQCRTHNVRAIVLGQIHIIRVAQIVSRSTAKWLAT